MSNSGYDRKTSAQPQPNLLLGQLFKIAPKLWDHSLQLLQVGSFFPMIPNAILHYYVNTSLLKIILTIMSWFLMMLIIDKYLNFFWRKRLPHLNRRNWVSIWPMHSLCFFPLMILINYIFAAFHSLQSNLPCMISFVPHSNPVRETLCPFFLCGHWDSEGCARCPNSQN